ncbi:MAG TPA: UDP-2,3-diacylglucosamine diphosphatase [Nitrococcus sp.]|nr:UDP-2,3-diacylglucosamine diphosphatase [Nitrococcus sp.]
MHTYDTNHRPVLFISDLHLDPSRPAVTRLFIQFLQQNASRAQALYILGDLFEAWIGDDALHAEDSVISALRTFSATAVPVYVMRGNRDFLLGEGFSRATGAVLLEDMCRIELDGIQVLLLHGDTLCTDDIEYQRFRSMVRDPRWQADFLAKPRAQRLAYAAQARQASAEHNRSLADALLDVSPRSVEQLLHEQGVRYMIHGHTHRPGVHHFELDGLSAQRIVLGDWYEQGSLLRCAGGRWQLLELPLARESGATAAKPA